jgi:dTDP-glucose 4,6-dehydratase
MHMVISGGCGFIGANFVKRLLADRPEWRMTVVDALTYAGNLATLRDVDPSSKAAFIKGDIADHRFVDALFDGFDAPPEVVVNFAAESHVDRSIAGPRVFIETNITGTFNLLEQLRRGKAARFVQISTDEVYGSLGDTGKFQETTPLNPNSPYAASKASADLLVQAYHRTYGVDAITTRCSNNYGPYQFPEKLIPLMIINTLGHKPLPVYGKGLNVRDWIHVEDHTAGILAALEQGVAGEVYHFGGASEVDNLTVVEGILDILEMGRDNLQFVADRPGHDWRYAMDFSKAAAAFGWRPRIDFRTGLETTVAWYVDNERWWRPILSGEYMNFYHEWYGDRISG